MDTTRTRSGRSGGVKHHRRPFSNSTPRHSHARKRTQASGAFQRSNRPRRQSGGGNFSARGNRGARRMPTFDPSQFINTNPAEEATEIYAPKYAFNTFGINAKLVNTILSLGMTSPTPIQDQIIPMVLEGRDVIGIAETGTGKTAAFLIPLIEKALKDDGRQTLVLVPTRELALQIEQELRRLSAGFRISAVTCVGGVNIRPQIKALRHPNHFVIGTPGRVLDLINRGAFTPRSISTAVLDEADRMLDMGFINDMKKILSTTPADKETLLFSATMSKDMEHIVSKFLHDPLLVSVKKKDVANSIVQDVVPYEAHTKFETLTSLLGNPEFKRVLIFGAMKHSVKKLAQELVHSGVEAESIHGNKSHSQRQRALAKFKNGSVRVLVATDVAARGIHVEDVTHVINYDLPNTFDDYVHRIGRTGRATKGGKALTFVPK